MTDLTQYDIKPAAMVNYLRYNGPHFTEKLANFAISKMRKDGKSLQKIDKEKLDTMMNSQNIKLDNNYLSDALYVINMAKADFWEFKHVLSHICDYFNIDEDSEEAAYLIGYIMRLFVNKIL